MNLIELSANLINEVQDLRKKYRSGKISIQTYQNELGGIHEIVNIGNMAIKTRITEERFKKPLFSNNLTALPDPEVEIVKCSAQQNNIERRSCLDFSGENKFPECHGCEVGAQSKTLLLGEAE